MRPDTEPNPHAKRIMAGAAIITAIVGLARGIGWLSNHYPTFGLAAFLFGMALISCYVFGILALDVVGGGA